MLAVPLWLLGTAFLFVGYGTQAAALDRGRLVVIQPLMVTTIVWALPLGWWLTHQHVTRRQIFGALVVVIGLAMFVTLGDPSEGNATAPTNEQVISIVVICAIVAGLLAWIRGNENAGVKAAVLGIAAGLFFGLSATFTKPFMNDLHVSLGTALGDWRTYALLGFGFIAMVIQQFSLATGQFAPAMAAVSVANPAISVILGILIYDERLTQPEWHVALAFAALIAALYGAVMITLGNQAIEMPDATQGDEAQPAAATT
jgi:drug/metabolite transporter (DMT)-like permease